MSQSSNITCLYEEKRKQCQILLKECIEGNKSWDVGKSKITSATDFTFDKKAFLDQVFRDFLLKLLQEERDNEDGWQEKLEQFVSLSVEWCREQYLTPTIPVVLLGDIFDGLALDKCEKMFAFVENGVNIWKEELFFAACKNNLLRMCNDLLRRLSRSQNTIFCGRILLFLAKFFPFSERSGLNIVSEFNLENITELGADTSGNLDESILEEDEEEKEKKSKLKIDYNLYCKFWALQDFFRNPNICYNKMQWKTFASHSSAVLAAFSSYKLEMVQLKESKNKKKKKSDSMDVDTAETHYFAKFLTNQKLLELQLSDTNFRRCVLVQFLILFQYLNSSVKFKIEAYELKSDQVDWIKSTTDLIYKLISETPPDGKSFANCVKIILKREEHWNTWKNDGCPEFKKLKNIATAESNTEENKPVRKRKKRLLGDIIKDYEEQGKSYLGNIELTKIWNSYPDNLEACKAKERDFLPSLESYLAEAIEQTETYVQEENKPDTRVVADGNFGWRALRLLARRTPHFFTHSNHPIHKLTEYLDIMIRKIAKDLPSSDAKKAKQEVIDEDVTDEQMEADLIKEGDPDDVEQTQESLERTLDNNEDEPVRAPIEKVSENHIDIVCLKLEADWKKLGAKLGYAADEILFFETSNPTEVLRCKAMLKLWADDDEDATVDNLVYILEGLDLIEAANALKET